MFCGGQFAGSWVLGSARVFGVVLVFPGFRVRFVIVLLGVFLVFDFGGFGV